MPDTNTLLSALSRRSCLTAAAKDVVAALSKQRVKVTPQQVYVAQAAMGKKPAKTESPDAAILAAKQLVDKLGSVEKSRKALDVLARLTQIFCQPKTLLPGQLQEATIVANRNISAWPREFATMQRTGQNNRQSAFA